MGPSPNGGEHVSNVVPVRSAERFNFSIKEAGFYLHHSGKPAFINQATA
jgi:hypothetical protein